MSHCSLMIGSACILFSGMCAALPQAQVKTGISSKTAAASHPSTTTTQAEAPLKRAALKANSSATKSATVKTRKSGKQSAAVVQPAPVVSPPAPPPQEIPQPPPRPEQMPPVPAKVTYQNGLLMVQAPNSTLSDIFNGIRSRASIQFEGAQGASDRVAANFGPAPADQVLTALLRGSRFDYVIIGAPDNPEVVQRVILTPRAGAAAPALTAAMPQRPGAPQSEDDEEDQPPSETVQPPPPVQPQPQGDPKTTQQLVEELQRMQEQQKLQEQQQQLQQQQQLGNSPLKPGAQPAPPPQGAPMIRPKMPPL